MKSDELKVRKNYIVTNNDEREDVVEMYIQSYLT